jgi:hypothetical protein
MGQRITRSTTRDRAPRSPRQPAATGATTQQCLLGYNLTDRLKLGPSLNWMISKDKEQNGVTVSGSARETLSVGADVYYRFSWLSVTFTYLYDVHTENSTKGNFFQIKTVYRF